MGRLENIIARNRQRRPTERLAVMVGLGLFLLIVLALMVFTDLGLPATPAAPAPPGPTQRVDGVLLRSPR